MKFRPCIDIHNGKVKQIVGGTLSDRGDFASENFVSEQNAAYYAKLYQKDRLRGGHIILLNPQSSPYYEANRQQALQALSAYPGGLQIGGGITDANAKDYLSAGASHVIVTSFVFQDGRLHYDHLHKLNKAVGREHLVLDLSCRKKKGKYYIVTDRWQKFSNIILSELVLEELAGYCDEFLIHAVDVEGHAAGIETQLAAMLGKWHGIPITYAGGVGSYEDLNVLRSCGGNYLDVTIGSALNLFGGPLEYQKVLAICDEAK